MDLWTQVLLAYILHVHFREEKLNTQEEGVTEGTIEEIKHIPNRQFHWLLNLATAKAQSNFRPKQKTLAIARKEIQLLRNQRENEPKSSEKHNTRKQEHMRQRDETTPATRTELASTETQGGLGLPLHTRHNNTNTYSRSSETPIHTGHKRTTPPEVTIVAGSQPKRPKIQPGNSQPSLLRPRTQPPTGTEISLNIHEHNGNKMQNWDLHPTRPNIIFGDSNLKRLPTIRNSQTQIDSFPGGNLTHAIHILRNKTPTSDNTKRVIISFGINNKDYNDHGTLKKLISRLYHTAQRTFPYADIYFQTLNFSDRLTDKQKINLRMFNNFLKEIVPNNNLILPLPPNKSETTADHIHWSPTTGQHMWNLWREHLN